MKTKQLIIIIIGLVLLSGLFFLISSNKNLINQSLPVQHNTVEQNSSPQASAATISAQLEGSKEFQLTIASKKLISGPSRIQLTEGDKVMLRITSDEAEEFHIHGYDVFTGLQPGQTATLSFTANQTGSFHFELEHSKTELGVVEVMPKE